MVLLVADHPHRLVVAHHGVEDGRALGELLAIDLDQVREADASHSSRLASWASAPVNHDGIQIGSLVVADRRRRWFDDEEVRHLGLMTFVAGPLIVELAPTLSDAVDVREQHARLGALA